MDAAGARCKKLHTVEEDCRVWCRDSVLIDCADDMFIFVQQYVAFNYKIVVSLEGGMISRESAKWSSRHPTV